MKKILLLLLIVLIFTSCMNLEDTNAGLWYSARSVNENYIELLKNKCNLEDDALEHSEYITDDREAYFKEKYGKAVYANASVCVDSLNNLTCDDLKTLVATDIEKSTYACSTIFLNNNLDACISFNYYFTEIIKNNCFRGEELSYKHSSQWSDGKFYCTEEYNNSFTKDKDFPPREVCMKKILNLNCDEIETNLVGKNIETELVCYVDGR